MGSIQGQLQFKLNQDNVVYYGGEHCLNDVMSIDSIVDGNQNCFVFICTKEGNVYYFIEADKHKIEYLVSDTGITCNLFKLHKDEKGRIVCFFTRDNELYMMRQQAFHPTLFEPCRMIYQAFDTIHNIDACVWNHQMEIAMIFKHQKSYQLIIGSMRNDFVFEDEYQVKSAYMLWKVEQSQLMLEVIGHDEIEVIDVLRAKKERFELQYTSRISNFMNCPSKHSRFQAFGLITLQTSKASRFCGIDETHTWNVLSARKGIVGFTSIIWNQQRHSLLLAKDGTVIHQMHDEFGMKEEVVPDLFNIRSLHFILVESMLKAYAVDAESNMLYSLVYLLPTGKWRITPLILYYNQPYKVVIRSDYCSLIHIPEKIHESLNPNYYMPAKNYIDYLDVPIA